MTFTLNKRVSVPNHVLFRELDNEAIILNLDQATYFGLDEIGVTMWQQLTTQLTIQDAYVGLLDDYDVEPDLLRSDLTQLIENLVAKGLVELTTA